MRKTDKKIDNQLRNLLTQICEVALQEIQGYKWVSHKVNYARFPESLVITCTFEDLYSAENAEQQGILLNLIQQKLRAANIELNNVRKQVFFTSQ
ncbi:hypothetical protein GCM10007916_15620 [Psychromonas marina]|uniref:Fis family transcriptional regulator n=1 Tax=Psychromonas marina TaxID=88364 RepID=A0ABQ6E002_9GAMM|nr:Fis family transcriptional regulator [Psychromonas marina]GLS90495.1 hypothetical protein GCM10007916_15620 [Psychromonas marina]